MKQGLSNLMEVNSVLVLLLHLKLKYFFFFISLLIIVIHVFHKRTSHYSLVLAPVNRVVVGCSIYFKTCLYFILTLGRTGRKSGFNLTFLGQFSKNESQNFINIKPDFFFQIRKIQRTDQVLIVFTPLCAKRKKGP